MTDTGSARSGRTGGGEVRLSRRKFLAAGVAGGSWLLAACTFGGATTTPTGKASTGTTGTTNGSSPYQVGKLEHTTVVTDPSLFPTTFREAPELAALVQSGDLPPVGERMGSSPLVLQPVHEVGEYSTNDVMRRGILGADEANPYRFVIGPDYFFWTNNWGEPDSVVPNLAQAFEMSSDGLALTIHLRPGMRWSDGEPFTADDIVFAFEDVYKSPDIGAYPDTYLQVNGQDIALEKVDDLTVRFVAPEPSNLFSPYLFAGSYGQEDGEYGSALFAPKHYLQQFHPTYVGQDEAARLAKDAGFNDWAAYLLDRSNVWLNADLPTVLPWKVVDGRGLNTRHFEMERNPYSIWVDTAGNQLPYIGTIDFENVQDLENLNLSAIAGKYDFQDRGLDMNKLPLMIENQKQSHYVIHLDPSEEVDFSIRMNLSYVDDPEIGDLFRTADFRRALSLGLDRDQLNEAFFLGIGEPSAVSPSPDNRFYPGDGYRMKWATHDVEQANALLDRLGLKMSDSGFRQRRDGKGNVRLRYSAVIIDTGEMIQQHWKEIGIDLDVESPSSTLLQQRAFANQMQLFGHQITVSDVFTSPDNVFPSDNYDFNCMNGIEYANWFLSDGKKGTEPFTALKELMELWSRGHVAGPDEQTRIGQEFWRAYTDQCLQIGGISRTVSVYGIHLARDTMGNVPERVLNSADSPPFVNGFPMAFYYK